jgi:sugar phosphate isomerase/epimerase
MTTLPVTRRGFIVGAGCLSGGAALGLWSSRSAAADKLPAAWPVTCRDAMLRLTDEKDCWAALHAVGAEGVEAEIAPNLALPGLFHPTIKYTAATAAGRERLAADAKAAGQRITAFCMMNRFDERPEMEIEWCGAAARAAQAMGVPAIRIDVAPVKLARPEFLKLAVAALSKIMAATEPTGVAFGIENHGTTTNDPAVLKSLFEQVGSKRLGLTLDTGNFYWFGHPLSKLYELYEAFAPRVFHTHCKSIHYPAGEREKQRPVGWKYGEYACPLGEGDIDFARVAAILRKAGYRNDLCIEDESIHCRKLSAKEATRQLTGQVRLLKAVAGKVATG